MRSHGIANFPDPGSGGQLPKADPQQLGVSASGLEAAQHTCQRLLPNTGGALDRNSFQQCLLAGDCPAALVRQASTEMRNFARCMRSHGVVNWPDPTIGPNRGPLFDLSAHGFSRQQARAPQVGRAQQECEPEMPDTGGVPIG